MAIIANSVGFILPKIFSVSFKKVLDICTGICYNDYSKREEEPEMTEWYMNPELHDEDYEEITELLTLLAEEDPEA